SYSITSSACAMRVGGSMIPSILAMHSAAATAIALIRACSPCSYDARRDVMHRPVRELAVMTAVGSTANGSRPLGCDPWLIPYYYCNFGVRWHRTTRFGLANLDLHQLRRRAIGRHPHGRTRGCGVDFEITHLVFRGRQVFGRMPSIHVDLVEPATAEIVRPHDLVFVIGAC